jgi:hypothetical protein
MGRYHAAVARDALRCALPVDSAVEKSPAKADHFPLSIGRTATLKN